MYKLSENIVPNVYNSMQISFLSLAWPWSGRSLPKGNQWECWDPGLGPNVARLPVHLPSPMPPYTPYTLPPLMPLHPAGPECPQWSSEPLHALPAPDTLHPLLAPCHPTPLTPQCPLTPPIPKLKSSCQEWYNCMWAWHVISLWVRLLFCHMYLICYCLQFSIDHLHVTLVIMIQIGSIFQIPLCIIFVTEMD